MSSKETIIITTEFARQIPIPYSHIHELPYNLKSPIKNKAFEQFIGRPPAHLVWAKDVSIANYNSIINMFPKNSTRLHDILNNKGRDIFASEELTLLESQINEFLSNSPNYNASQDKSYFDRLYVISLCVMVITKSRYIDSNFNVNSIDCKWCGGIEKARENWNAWIQTGGHKLGLTPAYDLLAAVAFLNPSIIGDVNKCKKAIRDLRISKFKNADWGERVDENDDWGGKGWKGMAEEC